MTPQEIIEACDFRITLQGDNAEVGLVIPGRWGKKDHRTLFGVRGDIVQELEDDLIVMFPALKLKKTVENELKRQKRRDFRG